MVPSYPIIRLRLTPQFEGESAIGLAVRLEIPYPNANVGQRLFRFLTRYNDVPGPLLRESDIEAVDDQGPLSVVFQAGDWGGPNTENWWHMDRATMGNLVLVYKVLAREVDIVLLQGTRLDLLREQRGLVGVGSGFLPDYLSNQVYRTVVEWSLPPNVPEMTKCVSSFGPGPGPASYVGYAKAIFDSVYMVGPIQSYPPTIPPAKQGGFGACHWLGEPPPNLRDKMARVNQALAPKMMQYFHARGETWNVFFRKGRGGHTGLGLLSSCIVEYNEDTVHMSDSLRTHLIAHEMVRTLSDMDREDNFYENRWFDEGLAEYYAAVLPYRFGVRDKDYLVCAINRSLQAYFTSPRLHMDIGTVYPAGWYANLVGCKRGCAYLMWVDGMLRRACGKLDLMQPGPLDEIVICMSHSRRRGFKFQIKNWIEQLGKHLPVGEMQKHLVGMLQGNIVDFGGLSGDDSPFRMFPCQKMILDFGFDIGRLYNGHLVGLVAKSPAYHAGLRNGDVLVNTTSLEACMNDHRAWLTVEYKRGDQKYTIKFCPRTAKTSAWEMREMALGAGLV
ncbi:hypothetical protein BO78DRAFT_467609 [Aspergillus sclerotiicarbonarius CBS 121057]|uniref:PDZ domain-containing protein n=1 Tax=Aspergillus sclerotiicarbonarius (strain CBS 121057 / IBT 28362) TaxID=1448318 RepID=A0A319FLR1_ASPSB|nr:hypothetical protein BO78DRAFT_467609 [Aspergillus sclerotiicarbonarius CBS 121057]